MNAVNRTRRRNPASKFNAPPSKFNAPPSKFNAPPSKFNAPPSKFNAPSVKMPEPINNNIPIKIAEPEKVPKLEPTEPVTEPVTAPVTAPAVTAPAVTAPVTEPVIQSSAPAVTAPVTEPVIQSSAPAVTAPVTEPVIQSSAPAVAAPVTEPVIQSSAPAVTAPVTEPAVASPLVQTAASVSADGHPPASSIIPDSDPTVSTNDNATTNMDDNVTTNMDDNATTNMDDNATTNMDDNATTNMDDNATTNMDDNVTTNNNATINANINANDAINANLNTNNANDANNATNPNCMIYPSLFSSADPSCYVPKPMPQIKQIVEAAIYDPISKMGSEFVQNILYATGNAALIEAAKARALTPEQAELLNNLSSDPQVAAELEKFQDKLSNAVAQGIQQAGETVTKPAEEALGKLTTGAVDAVVAAVSDIPLVGFGISAATAVQTGVDAVENATDIADKLKQAAAPVTQAMAEVGDLTTAMNNAASSAEGAASGAVDGATNAAKNAAAIQPIRTDEEQTRVEAEADAKINAKQAEFLARQQQKRDAQQPTASTLPRMQTGKVVDAQKITPENQGIVAVGGSRKRRHIHKLSRRIERTLRRVQKKYGLKDKNDFLRRTLRHRKP